MLLDGWQLGLDKTRGMSFLFVIGTIPQTTIETKQKMNTPSIFLPNDFFISKPINPNPHLQQPTALLSRVSTFSRKYFCDL